MNNIRNIILLVGIVLLLSPISSATEHYTVNYTDTYNKITYTMEDDKLHINIPQGNYIDFIEFRPKYLPTNYKERTISTTVYLNDEEYKILHTLDTNPSVLNLFSSHLDYKLELFVDGQQNYLKEYENKIFDWCYFSTYIRLGFGNSVDIGNDQIGIDSHIIGHRGKIRYQDTVSVYDTDSYLCTNITIEKTEMDELLLHIGYRLESVRSKEYYISQLSPTLENVYKIGFNWLDKDNYILNLFLITDYILRIMMFGVVLVSTNLAILTFIHLIFVVPFLAFYNSRTQSGFIDNLFKYYTKTAQFMSIFMTFMIRFMLKCIEIVRSLIPFV